MVTPEFDIRVYELPPTEVDGQEPSIQLAIYNTDNEECITFKANPVGLTKEAREARRVSGRIAAEDRCPFELTYDQLSPKRERPRVRQAFGKLQGGLCAYCGEPLAKQPSKAVREFVVAWSRFPSEFRSYPVHLHHDHETGFVLGTVHMLCNAVSFCKEGV